MVGKYENFNNIVFSRKIDFLINHFKIQLLENLK